MQEFKILSDNNVHIALTRRWMGNKEHGMLDVYRLFMAVVIGGEDYHWGYLIMPDSIKYLQKYIENGIAALKKKIDEV